MKIQVLYFARVRELLGPGETVDLSDAQVADLVGVISSVAASGALPAAGAASQPFTVGGLRMWLAQRSASHAQALGPDQMLRAACNQQMCGPEQELSDGAEVAFFPPVTGG
jgi:molybdopterin converting factor small subunit